ncbi:hypothetical protein [Actinomadura fibrosa]|uniref:Transcriptional regulator n=1 Tax=Actinomadura fibrosa TaxID=111802 RepID=A0ABW2XDD9_9ACTN|nr:hypothetical protein [Actinomadura fibrosa]
MTDGGVVAVLGTLERERRTGVLRAGDDGALYLDGGAVVRAESRHAPGPEDLLGGPDPELLALFDAAYFVLGSEVEPQFIDGPVPDAPCRVTAATLVHECRRRRALLASAWPSADVDVAPVVPVRRVRRQRVILTGLQAEILLNADGDAAPAELARRLGRTAFACLLAVRGLAAAALVQAPPLDGAPAAPHDTPAMPDGASALPAGWAPADHDLLARLRAALAELA